MFGLASMSAANAGRIDHTHPNPINASVLKLQPTHRSEAIWNGQLVVSPKQEKQACPHLQGQIEGYLRLLSRHPMGTEDLKDITDVLNAVQEIGRVRSLDLEAPNEDIATPVATHTQRLSTIESPSTSTTPAGRPPVATPQVVPTPDPSPSTSRPSFSPTIPSPTPRPSPSPPHPSPSSTIPPPTPYPCPKSDIRPPTPQSFPELSPIPSFNLGIGPTPPDMQ
ncbi:hypothetical protein CFP56_025577 [Quercus suber]|uniref:Uncharacterized protein n=1 Tax=Quercus suber TaxID=58331 RepID=A0AAW0K4M0_QUESU